MSERYGAIERHLAEPSFSGGTVGAMTLGERLRAAIDAKNKSHAWVAAEAGITAASLSAILTGKTADPSFFTVLAIARAIDEPLSAIVDDPLVYWTSADLDWLSQTGELLVERTKRTKPKAPLEIPARKKTGRASAPAYPVAATSEGELYPDAFEQPRKNIPAKYKKKKADTVFSVNGESMTGENIHPGDLLYVRRTSDLDEANGRIVVCSVDDTVLVKRFSRDQGAVVLTSAHPRHKSMVIADESRRCRLIGIVVGTSRT